MRWRALAMAVVLVACVTDEWAHVRGIDTSDAYRRFATQNPDSPYAPEALERADYIEFRNDPSFEAFEAFRGKHPHSSFLRRSALLFEEESYTRARRAGSLRAYQEFIDTFQEGEYVERARAAVEYLGHDGFAGDSEALAAFVARYPNSEFGEEARRALEALDARHKLRFARIGLRIEIAPGVASPDRVERTFTQRARQAYAQSGVQLLPGSGSAAVDGWLVIRHREKQVTTHLEGDTMAPPGVLAETDLTLQRAGEGVPIWQERFTLRVADSERRSDTSILFSPRAPLYWSNFFVPVATWPTQLARRGTWASTGPVADVDASADRAVALYRDGSFDAVALADPTQPSVVSEYRRKADLAKFAGVVRAGTLVVAYGQDGLEISQVTSAGGAQMVRRLERGEVGSVSSVARVGDGLLLVSSRGLLRVQLPEGEAEVLIDAKLRALAPWGERLLLADDQWVYAVPIDDVRRDSIKGVAKLERGFEPRAIRVDGSLAAVLGAKEVLCLQLYPGRRARVLARFQEDEIGAVADATLLGGRLFTLGVRGLQVIDPVRGRLLDSVDVEPREALSRSGRLLVAGGKGGIQTVDATPWLPQQPAAAAPRPAR